MPPCRYTKTVGNADCQKSQCCCTMRVWQVGLESVEVTEVQRVVWGGSGSFTVSSETHVTNLMGACWAGSCTATGGPLRAG